MQLAVAFSGAGLMSMLPRLGMMAGGMMLSAAARKNQPTNRLSDLKVSGSSYGRGLPICYGTMRCTGNMVWATDLEEVKTYVGAKGKQLGSGKGSKKAKKGKANIVYLYYANFAMAMCEGTKSDVIRIWCDSNLIYDKYASLVYDAALNKWLPGYTDDQGQIHPVMVIGFSQGITGPGKSGGGQKKGGSPGDGSNFPYRFYGGSEDQQPDPYMQDKSGTSATPAYRGTCYLFFEHFPLRDFGNRVPTVTAEVVDSMTRETQILAWTPLTYSSSPSGPDQTDVPTYDRVDRAWVDPAKNRLYQVAYHLDSVHWVSHYTLREWDTQQAKEVKRFDIQTPLSSPGIMGSDMQGGFTVGENNWPHYSNVAYMNSETALQSGSGSATFWPPALTFPLVQASQDPSNPTKYATVTKTMFGYVYVDPPPDIIYGTAAGPFENQCVVVPGCPGTDEDILVIATNFTLSDQTGVIYGVSSLTYKVKAFITLPHEEPYMSIEPPVWMQGADCYMILVCNTVAGKWKVYTCDKGGAITWMQEIGFPVTGNYQLTNFPGGPNAYAPLSVCTGSKWMGLWSSAVSNTLVEIDALLQTITIAALDSYIGSGTTGAIFPYVINPQFYLEDYGAIVYWGEMLIGGSTVLGWWQAWVDKFQQPQVDVAEICMDVCERVGIPRSKINVVGMNPAPITGYLLDNPSPARKIIEDLAQVYFFDVAEVDGVLKFISRGQLPAVTVLQKDLGTVSGDAAEADQATTDPNDWYVETRTQEIDIPQTVHVSFIDPGMDYQNGTQGWRRPISPNPVMQSREVLDINLPVALSNSLAKQIAETVCMASWTERINHKFLLPTKFLQYDATDVIMVYMDSGLTFIDRMLKFDVGANLTIDVESVSQLQPYYVNTPTVESHHSSYDPKSNGTPGWGVVGLPKVSDPMVQPLVMDIPLISDSDANTITGGYPLYWGAGAWGSGYAAGSFQDMVANNGTWNNGGMSGADPPWGTVPTATPAPLNGPFVTDATTTITLSPEYDYEAAFVYEWQDISDANWPSEGTNMILVGDEIILFKTAVVNADSSITLSTLIRGHRGTENACYTHVAFERFVVLDSDGNAIRMSAVQSTALNGNVTGRITGFSAMQAFSPTQTIVYRGKALMPYAPSDIERSDDGSHNAVITWQRRTRFNGVMQDGSGTVPLNEDSEKYRVYLCTAAVDAATFDPTNPAHYAREVDGLTSPTYTYTAANRTTDGLANGDPFWAVVYQVSGEVGLGSPAIVKLETDTPSYR